MSVNKVILVGNVGQDPEIKTFDWGKVANFSLATSETYKDKNGEKVTQTEWHNIVVKFKLVDIVEQWVKKGQQLYVEGSIKTRSWDDKEGNKHYMTEIEVGFNGAIQMIGKKSDNQPADTTAATAASTEPKPLETAPPPGEDDLPF